MGFINCVIKNEEIKKKRSSEALKIRILRQDLSLSLVLECVMKLFSGVFRTLSNIYEAFLQK